MLKLHACVCFQRTEEDFISCAFFFFPMHLWGIMFVIFSVGAQLGTSGYQRKGVASFLGSFIQATKNYMVIDGSS